MNQPADLIISIRMIGSVTYWPLIWLCKKQQNLKVGLDFPQKSRRLASSQVPFLFAVFSTSEESLGWVHRFLGQSETKGCDKPSWTDCVSLNSTSEIIDGKQHITLDWQLVGDNSSAAISPGLVSLSISS